MSVRARFYLQTATAGQMDGEPCISIEMTGVNKCVGPQPDEEDEDSIFGKFTPNAKLTMTVIGPAVEWFRDHLGKKIDVTLHDPE